ncbi:MAG TPA: Rrf2 family transcriptional regulator [Rhizomicrobium sp.]|jgi:Rrf2 family iron-sulfur cluster assembly transcriptional regulator
MKLSTKGRYAVMAMADLAGHEAGVRAVSLADVARRQEISLSYLEQLFAKLRRHGLVKSVRGPGGGYRLSQPAAEMRVADIILAVDEPIRATRCLPGSARGCTGTTLRCVAHDLWEELGQQIHVFLSSISLADVVERRVLGRAQPCRPAGVAAENSRAAA